MVKINDKEFASLCDYIGKHYGLNLTKKRILIEYRLMNVLQTYGFTSFDAYLKRVFEDPSGKMETEMINRITTNYSFFLREPQHFTFIKQTILPTCSMNQPLQIWIAGCAQGQECYSLAMLLEDCKREGLPVPEYHIYASDINTAVLQKAKEGVFPLEAMHVLPQTWQERYCRVSEAAHTFEMKEQIKKHIHFYQHNLKEPNTRGTYDLIMCRNVLIYFDTVSRNELYARFHANLKKNGYLILGLAEMIPQGNPYFEYLGSSIYEAKECNGYGDI